MNFIQSSFYIAVNIFVIKLYFAAPGLVFSLVVKYFIIVEGIYI